MFFHAARNVFLGRDLANRLNETPRGRRLRRSIRLLAVALGMSCAMPAFAQINITNSTDLNNAIQLINATPAVDYTLNFVNDFSLGQQVADINTNGTITLVGNSKTVDGGGLYQPLLIDSGTIKLQGLNITGTGAPVSVNGGTLIDTTGSLKGAVTNNSAVQFNLSAAGTYNGNMSGTGSVEVSGIGPATFAGTNSYTGGTTVDSHSTLIGTTDSLHGSITNNWLVTFSQSTAGTYAGVMDGSGGVEIDGSGPVTFTGLNTYTGGTYITAGSSLIGSTTSLHGPIIDYGSLTFNQNSAGNFADNISGIGTVTISGTGPVTFSGTNNYAGGTAISSVSTLIGTTSSLQGNFLNSGLLKIDQSTAGTFNGAIAGTGSLEISGAGPVTLTGANIYTGGTLIDTGSTLISNTTSLQGSITNNGAVQFMQNTQGAYLGDMTGAGSVEIGGGASVRFSGNNSYAGGTTIDSGSLLSGTTSGLQGNIVNNGGLQFSQNTSGAFNGTISGSGSVEFAGTGQITMGLASTYTGGTTIDSGSKVVAGYDSLGTGNIVNNGSLNFNDTYATPFSPGLPWLPIVTPAIAFPGQIFSSGVPVFSVVQNISGTGQVEISGNGATALTGVNTYTGGTIVDHGSSLIGNTTSLQGNITNNGTVEFSNVTQNQPYYPTLIITSNVVVAGPDGLLRIGQTPMQAPSDSQVYAGTMSGTGNLVVDSLVHLKLTGPNTYTGGTLVSREGVLTGNTSSLQGPIDTEGYLIFQQDSSGVFAGNITGGGAVQVTGAGPVTFSGINSYTGGTNVGTGSTLIGTTSSLQGTIFNNGALQFNQSTAGTFAGNIRGGGAVEISGVGPVTFSTANSYTGVTTIDHDGTLIVNSTGSLAGPVQVGNGGTLQGTGSVGATTVNAGGTIKPGTVGSPLTINGTFTQGTGSTYTSELNPTGSDKIVVNGAATINNGTNLNLTLDQGKYTVGTHFQILSATGGLTGHYSTLSTSPLTQHIAFSQQYGANDLQVVVNSNLLNGTGAPLTSNQAMLAALLDNQSGNATGDFANSITQLTTFNSGQLSNALNQLSGDIYANVNTVTQQTSTAQLQLISNRLAGLNAPGVPNVTASRNNKNGIRLVSMQSSDPMGAPAPAATPGRPISGWSGWAQGYGLGGSVNSDGNATGSNYRLGGTLFGVENWVSDNVMIGVLGGYAATTVDQKGVDAKANINSYQGGLYELFRQDSLYISNIDAYTNNDYSTSRSINLGTPLTASGSSTGNQWSHYTELGTTIAFDDILLQPFVGVQYLHLDQKGYQESGAGAMDLSVNQQTLNSIRNSFGARLTAETMWGNTLVIPTVAARYQHEWGDGTQVITSSFSGAPTAAFNTNGSKIGRDFGLFTVGATGYLTEHLSIYGSVDAQVASNFFGVIGSGGLQYQW